MPSSENMGYGCIGCLVSGLNWCGASPTVPFVPHRQAIDSGLRGRHCRHLDPGGPALRPAVRAQNRRPDLRGPPVAHRHTHGRPLRHQLRLQRGGGVRCFPPPECACDLWLIDTHTADPSGTSYVFNVVVAYVASLPPNARVICGAVSNRFPSTPPLTTTQALRVCAPALEPGGRLSVPPR